MGDSDLGCCLDCGRDLDEAVQLCAGCTARLRQRLSELPELYRALEAELVPGASGMGGTRRAKSPDAPLPVVEEILSLRGPGGMLGFVEDWQSAVWQELGQGKPPQCGTFEQRMDSAVASLRFNLMWITGVWEQAGEFADEIRKLHAAGESVVAPKPQRVRVGHCTALVEDGTECAAVLWWTPGERGLTCKWCGYEVPPSMWMRIYKDLNSVERKAS